MNEPSLPEDLSRWPKGAYELLGVNQEVNPRDLRRIYTRLIRKFKPEQFPEHFRRIREAYEIVLRQAEFFQTIRGARAEEDDDTDGATAEAPAETDGASEAPAAAPWRPAPSLVDELTQLWRQACTGEEAAVYRRLLELHEAEPRSVDVLLRLYWLLALTRELDAKRKPCEWLAEGLYGGLGGPLWELYRREIAEEPAEAFSERGNRLMRQPTQTARLAELAEWRFQAAARLGRWQPIDDDLEILHERLAIDEPETWVQLLISAAELLAAMPGDGPRALLQECQKQIEHFGQLHTRLAANLDRMEFNIEVGAALGKLPPWPHSPVPKELAELIAVSWTRPFVDFRPLLVRYLEHVAADPVEALKELETVQARAAPVLAQLSNILMLHRGWFDSEFEDPRARETLARLVRDFVDEGEAVWNAAGDLRTGIFRQLLLRFCLQESITPEVVAEVAEDPELAMSVTNDRPLRCVFWACRLFGG
jgi:hypothetical protein